ncbi:MAG: TRAP transporter large permease [Roseibium album]|uniref:TRAP transporter large permease n=1 Tax=Roseibium album TaxID=311410 RepID=UPI000CF0EE3F|nr:TRAP transporter large permease [Roseibium album]MBG6147361.1 tripartite ATP-independent transporter DctM subunit [Labrenzia sp. EL_142]MBG6178046.1 tripartite ATP-independent transporter DctM subunit [Labrenzia sp. EL_132]MBG6204955.1 tripartite ATP-independent transporter DctM subunit [Labrenzia sp. EL_13]MBG6208842.1 tripartite ATP-independent transporter DctM subunit [Labrenzia sp. EL_126]MBG6232669.1 tripartite ATP-independent transporter DctM subunit [Labrenzia sp. EL_208]
MLMAAIFCALLAMICINVPIAVALAMCGVIGLLAVEGTGSLVTIALDMYDGSTKFSLIAIPMFVLAGAIMNAGGITDRLINFVSAIIGFIRGGLAMVNIGVSLFFAEISGSAVADVAAMGSILIPQMKKRGYSKEFSAAVTSSSASLAIIIPPSIPMILYAASANTSVEQLFVAGVVPGLLGAAGLMGVAYAFAKRYDYPVEEAFNLPRVRETFKDALPAFALPVIILGGIFGGFVTATEAAGLAVLAALVVSAWYRNLNLAHLRRAMLDGGIQTAVVMLLVAASVLMGGFLTRAQIPQQLAEAILSVTAQQWAILLILNFFFLIIGFFLHSAAAIILVVPIVIPLISAAGIDPVHFGLVVTLNLAIGQQTPPVASVLITSCSVARANIWAVSKVNIWFVAVLLAVLMLCTYVPTVPMFLVEYFYR